MSSTPQQVSPQALFDSCKRREGQPERFEIDAIRRYVAKEIFFRPIFEAADTEPQAQNTTEQAIWRGAKYRDLIQLLQKAGDRKARWIILARWLRQEKVCEPEDFLPPKFSLDSLADGLSKGTRRRDPLHLARVEIWLPYFQRLITDIKVLREQKVQRIREELVTRKYDPAAIEEALKHERSALEALYHWLGKRHNTSPGTFRNALDSAKRNMEVLPPVHAAKILAREIGEIGQQPEFLTPPKARPSRRKKTKNPRL
jgi:hypothetical protein